MDKAELLVELRILAGSPSEKELPEKAIELAINHALKKMSRLRPKTVYRELSLQSGQDTYTLDSDVQKVTGLWLNQTTSDIDPLLYSWFSEADVSLEYAGLSTFHSPSLITILEQKLESWHNRRDVDWDFHQDTAELRILPEPDGSGKAIYKANITRDLPSIEDKYEDGFTNLCLSKVLKTLAITRSHVSSIPTGNGSMGYDTRALSKMAKDAEKDAYKDLNLAKGGIVVG